jgi:hypothetical protein
MAVIYPTLFVVLYFSLNNLEGKAVTKSTGSDGNSRYSIPQNQLNDASLYTPTPIPNSIQVTMGPVLACGQTIYSANLYQPTQ